MYNYYCIWSLKQLAIKIQEVVALQQHGELLSKTLLVWFGFSCFLKMVSLFEEIGLGLL